MKSKFPGYFPPSDDEKKQLFESATFVFDASVLLNIYSYSEQTRDEFLGLLDELSERIWVPYQCTQEFLKNRTVRISGELKKFDEQIQLIDKFGKSFDEAHRNGRAHPFYSDVAQDNTDALVALLTKELKENRAKVRDLLHNDPMLDRLSGILDARVGDPFPPRELETIYKEGKKRYSAEVPPGYADKKDKPEPACYGDLVFWKEIINFSKKQSCDLILATDDSKEDWWHKIGSTTLGPRPELLQEFATTTEHQVLIYSGFNFIKRASELLNEIEVSAATVEEVERSSARSLIPKMNIQMPTIGGLSALSKFQELFDSKNRFESNVANAIKSMNALASLHSQSENYAKLLSNNELNSLSSAIEKISFPPVIEGHQFLSDLASNSADESLEDKNKNSNPPEISDLQEEEDDDD